MASFDHLLLPLIDFNDFLCCLQNAEEALRQMLEETPEFVPEVKEHIEKACYHKSLAVEALEKHQKILMSWTRDTLNECIRDHGQLPPISLPRSWDS